VCAIYRSVCVLNKRNKSNQEETDKVKITIAKERETERKTEAVNGGI
jgi:hypothetical protein